MSDNPIPNVGEIWRERCGWKRRVEDVTGTRVKYRAIRFSISKLVSCDLSAWHRWAKRTDAKLLPPSGDAP